MNRKELNHNLGVAIVHGKTEYCMVRYIFSNLHLKFGIYAKEKGCKSIQINGLKNILSNYPFDTKINFEKEYLNGLDIKKLDDFKIFIIMDTDDCNKKRKDEYISKELFKKYWLYDYIVPIYNNPNIEKTFLESKVSTRKIKDFEKGNYYSKIFPVNDDKLSNDTLEEIKEFRKRIESVSSSTSNLILFIDYCIKNVKTIYP